MKKILFDVYELAPGAGKSIGVYNYARHLLAAIALSPRSDFEIVVVCNSAALKDFSPFDPLNRLNHFIRKERPPNLASRLGWIFGGAALTSRRVGANIYFSPRGFLPVGLKVLSPSITTIVTIHDLIRHWYREHYPDYFNWAEQVFICASLSWSARYADRVISISGWSAKDLRDRTGRVHEVSVVYNGLVESSMAGKILVRDRFFAIGSKLPHKNTALLVAAYKRYRKMSANPIPLTICGMADPKVNGIDVVHSISDEELGRYYALAKAFIFLSLIEGFGFPPLEAMSKGTAVICSDIEVLREVTKGQATFVSPTDELKVAEAMLKFEGNYEGQCDSYNADLRREVGRSYRWTETAAQTLEAILRSK